LQVDHRPTIVHDSIEFLVRNPMHPQPAILMMPLGLFATGMWMASLPSVFATRAGSLRKPQAANGDSDGHGAGGVVVIPLQRLPARNASGMRNWDTSFYVGNITVGQPPQHLQVFFDTASGHVLLPHAACKNKTCLEHHRYSPWASSSAVDINADGKPVQDGNRLAKGRTKRTFATLAFSQADLGDGIAKGVLVRDHVCLSVGQSDAQGHQACADLAVLAATQEDAMPFEAMPADGIIGLGLSGLSVSAFSNFYSRLMDSSHGMLPEFGMLLGDVGGKLTFGGHHTPADSQAMQLEWLPILHPDEGFWQVELTRIAVGGKTVERCLHGCRAIIDTGSAHLGIQADKRDGILRSLKSAQHSIGGRCTGPDMHIGLAGGLALRLSAADYSDHACVPQLGALQAPEPNPTGVLFSLGTNVIRRYYTAFDWETPKVGFAPNPGSPPLRTATPEAALAAEVDLVV